MRHVASMNGAPKAGWWPHITGNGAADRLVIDSSMVSTARPDSSVRRFSTRNGVRAVSTDSVTDTRSGVSSSTRTSHAAAHSSPWKGIGASRKVTASPPLGKHSCQPPSYRSM